MTNFFSRLASPTCLLYTFFIVTQVAAGFYVASGLEPPGLFTFVLTVGSIWIIGWWLRTDSQKRGVGWVYDMGLFLYLAWPLVLPYYLFKTRGPKALLVIVGFVAAFVGAVIFGMLLYLFLAECRRPSFELSPIESRRTNMKQLFVIVVIFLVAPIVNAQTPKAFRDDKVERELIELVRKWDAANVSRDIATLDHILADEFTLTGTPKKAYLAFIKSPNTVIESAVSDNFDVRVYKDMAVLIARDTVTLIQNGVKVVETFRYIDVWVKRDGRWQCVVTESHPIKQ